MSKYGLLAGLGAGISQGAQLLSQGMAEDRAARREAERERRREELEAKREASKERRWNLDRQDRLEARKEDRAFRESEQRYRKERDEINDAWRVQERDLRQIEGEMGRLYQESIAAQSTISDRFDNQIKSFQSELNALYRASKGDMSGLGLAGDQQQQVTPDQIQGRITYLREQIADLSTQRETKLKEFRSEFQAQAVDIASSYDPEIIGRSSFKGYINHMNKSLARLDELSRVDTPAPKDTPTTAGSSGSAEPDAAPEPGATPASVTDTPKGFGFGSGFDAARRALLERSEGGFYDALVANNSAYDPEHTNMFGHILHPIGGAVGTLAGIGQAAVGGLMDLPGVLMETPAQAKARQATTAARGATPQAPSALALEEERRRQEMLNYDRDQRARVNNGYVR